MEWIVRRAFVGYNMHRVEGRPYAPPHKRTAIVFLTVYVLLILQVGSSAGIRPH